MPASRDPRTVPHSATETVKPSSPGDSAKVWIRLLVVPEITAVSKPNRRPPRAATTVLFKRYAFTRMLLLLGLSKPRQRANQYKPGSKHFRPTLSITFVFHNLGGEV